MRTLISFGIGAFVLASSARAQNPLVDLPPVITTDLNYSNVDVQVPPTGCRLDASATIKVTNGSIFVNGPVDGHGKNGDDGHDGTDFLFPTGGDPGGPGMSLTLVTIASQFGPRPGNVVVSSTIDLHGGNGGRGGNGVTGHYRLFWPDCDYVNPQNGFPGGSGGNGGSLSIQSAGGVSGNGGIVAFGGNAGNGGSGGGVANWAPPGVRAGQGSYGPAGGVGGSISIASSSGSAIVDISAFGVSAYGGKSGDGGNGGWANGHTSHSYFGGWPGNGGEGFDGPAGGKVTITAPRVNNGYPGFGADVHGGQGGAGGHGGAGGWAHSDICGCWDQNDPDQHGLDCTGSSGDNAFPAGDGGAGGTVKISASSTTYPPALSGGGNMSITANGGDGSVGGNGGDGGFFVDFGVDPPFTVYYGGGLPSAGGDGGRGGVVSISAPKFAIGGVFVDMSGGNGAVGGLGGSTLDPGSDAFCPRGQQGGAGGAGGKGGSMSLGGLSVQSGSFVVLDWFGGNGADGGPGGNWLAPGGVRGRAGGNGTYARSVPGGLPVTLFLSGAAGIDGMDGAYGASCH